MSTAAADLGSATAPIERRGLMLVLSSPSGAGKTTLSRRLIAEDKSIRLSISVTTRKPRPGEVDGKDYFFVDHARFAAMREAGKLLEWAQVFDNQYGTPRDEAEGAIGRGEDILFDIDWQGAQQLAAKMPDDIVRVFILPPSGEILEKRLAARAQDSAEVVARRMAAASAEISHWGEYDYVIVNGELEESVAGLRAIVAAERLKRHRQPGLVDFVRRMQQAL